MAVLPPRNVRLPKIQPPQNDAYARDGGKKKLYEYKQHSLLIVSLFDFTQHAHDRSPQERPALGFDAPLSPELVSHPDTVSLDVEYT